MPMGFRKDGTKLGFQKGHKINSGKNSPWFGKNGKEAFNYKHGKTLEKYHCIDCGKKVSTFTVKRCCRCAGVERMKRFKNPMTGRCGESNPNWRGGKPKCIDCGKELSSRGSINERYKRCTKCKSKLENNSNWIGGISFEPYPLGWNKTFKEQIRNRDGYKCQICGVHEVDCFRKLDVHHINYNKKDLSLKNLVSLCQRCHAKTNYGRPFWLGYFDKKLQVGGAADAI
jgi:DNA-directed RNA polymerase subunit RPC12/RpoP